MKDKIWYWIFSVFVVWLVCGALYEIGVPFWTVNIPLTGIVTAFLYFGGTKHED